MALVVSALELVMAHLWLPIKEETSGRERLILIPFASHMDISQLREIIQWQEENTKAQLKKLGPIPKNTMSREEIQGALKDYIRWLRKKRGEEL